MPNHVTHKLLDWLTPPDVYEDVERLRRARVFSVICCLLATISPLRATGFFLVGAWWQAGLYLTLFFLNIMFIGVLRRGGELWWPVQLFAGSIFTVVALISLQRGGIGAPILVIHGVLPVAVTYVVGIRAGVFWWVLGLLFVSSVSILEAQGVVVWDDMFPNTAHVTDTLVVAAASSALILMAAIFEWSRREAMAQVKKMEQQRATAEANVLVLRADRMASVGVLAAGVGHEVNNPLTYIQGNIDYALSELESPAIDREALIEALADARSGVTRIAKIVKDLRAFSRTDDDEQPSSVALSDIVRAAVQLTQRELDQRASLELELGQDRHVEVIESKLVQVIVNLLINAAHALEKVDDGRVTIRSGTRGGMSWLEVADTGPGMSANVQRRAFDPFFTTKDVGKGTGLGLAVSKAIVEAQGGTITLRSTLGKGTIVRLSLPLASEQHSQEASPERTQPGVERRILLVEDEQKVARALIRMLSGYTIEWCESGQEAIERLAQDSSFDLVLCDVMMNPISGWDVLEHVEHHHPYLAPRFVFMTGGAFTAMAQEALENATVPVLFKPIDRSDIVERFRRLDLEHGDIALRA